MWSSPTRYRRPRAHTRARSRPCLADRSGRVLIGRLGRLRLGRASLRRDQAFQSQSLVLGHVAEAIVGDELAWRGPCAARAAQQLRGLPPWRPTGTELLEHRVSHWGIQPLSEGWLRRTVVTLEGTVSPTDRAQPFRRIATLSRRCPLGEERRLAQLRFPRRCTSSRRRSWRSSGDQGKLPCGR
jgi:hypothetical protein